MNNIKLTEVEKEKIFNCNDNFNHKGKSYRYLIGTLKNGKFLAKRTFKLKELVGDEVWFNCD